MSIKSFYEKCTNDLRGSNKIIFLNYGLLVLNFLILQKEIIMKYKLYLLKLKKIFKGRKCLGSSPENIMRMPVWFT